MDVIVVTMAVNARKVMVVKPKWNFFFNRQGKILNVKQRIKFNMQTKPNFDG